MTASRPDRRRTLIAKARGRLRAGRSPRDPFAAYQAEVEPALAGQPRVHRFAAPPVVAAAGAPAEKVAAWLPRDVPAPPHGGTVLRGGLRQALAEAGTPWVAVADATLAPLALERLGQAALLAPDAAVLTADEDVVDAAGRRSRPRFFPGPSPDHLLVTDGPLALLCVRREAALRALADIPDTLAWRAELLLRLAGPDGAGHAHVPVILAHRRAGPSALPGDVGSQSAIRTLTAWGAPAPVTAVTPGRRRVERAPVGEPLVDVVVLFRDRPELLERCADSVLRRSTWERLRLRLVDNGSTDPRVAELLRRLERDQRVVVQRDERAFNFAALNNAAVASSDADVIVFLNNDTEVITPGWIEGLLGEAQRPEVGAVAPLLRYPDGSVQHAGAALGLHGYAGHPFAGLSPSAETPFGRADGGTRNWLAVTAACLMVGRRKLEAVGGFVESFVVAGNDVDLCLRLTGRGHRSLCVPHVEFLHDESRSRGAYIDPGDFARSEVSYGEFRTIGDPFYNPNLTLTATTCQPRQPGETL